MKKQLVIAFILFTLLTTVTFKAKNNNFTIEHKKIIVENNS